MLKRRARPFGAIAAVTLWLGLGGMAQPEGPARAYLAEAVRIVRERSLHSAAVDWPRLEREAAALIAEPGESAGAYPAVRHVLAGLGDSHSSFLTPEEARRWRGSGSQSGEPRLSGPLPRGRRLSEHIAYLQIPMFNSGDPRVLPLFADRVQAEIAIVDGDAICGWVVDLRKNLGGNAWPMIAGVGPLLGEGTVMRFAHANGQEEIIAYSDGRALRNGEVQAAVTGSPYRLANPSPPVAVLTSPMTASSGEVLLVSFIGRPRTRTFGLESHGLSTLNSEIDLADGALIFLTTGRYRDRAGATYSAAIAPDVRVEFPWSIETEFPLQPEDPAIERAVAWLEREGGCRARG